MSIAGLDLNILKALSTRDRFRALRPILPDTMLDGNTIELLRWFEQYFSQYEDHLFIEPAALMTLVRLRMQDSPEAVQVFEIIVGRLQEPIDETTLRTTVEMLEELRMSGEAAAIISRYQNGEEVDIVRELKLLAERTSNRIERTSAAKWADADPLEYILAEADDSGLQWTIFPQLRESLKGVRPGKNIAVAMPTDKGKCLAPDTLVRMHAGGVKRAADVQVGDLLAGVSGPRRVLGTTTGRDQMYRISYPWGEYYDVNSEHILSLKRTADGTKGCPVGTTVNIPVHEYIGKSANWKHIHKGWKAGIEYPTAVQRMPAYLLGAWLGDGTASKPQLTSADPAIVHKFIKYYGAPSVTRPAGQATTYDFYRTGMLADLTALGVRGNKHIPREYMEASSGQRKQLLAGLLDTDGHNTGCGFEITQKSEQLALQIVDLARSLGIHATVKREFKRAVGTSDTGYWYSRVCLGSEVYEVLQGWFERPAHIGMQQHHNPKRHGLHFGITVTALGEGEYAGFGLDGDHLFLLGDYTVTHNTSLLCQIAVMFAEQAAQMKDEYDWIGDRPLLFLVNEGTAEAITPRVYQTALHCTFGELLREAQAGTLIPKYEAVVGRRDAIRLVNIHGMNSSQVYRIIEAHNPYGVITDMTGRIKASSNSAGGSNDVSQVEEVWNAMRENTAILNHFHIGTVQISAEGFDQLYPPLSALQNSKVGIQTTLDLVLMGGALNAAVHDSLRGISTPKNKLARSGCKSLNQFEVCFDPTRNVWDAGISVPTARST